MAHAGRATGATERIAAVAGIFGQRLAARAAEPAVRERLPAQVRWLKAEAKRRQPLKSLTWPKNTASRACRPSLRRPRPSSSRSRPGWRGPRQAQVWLRSLERYALPRIGKRLVSEVASADVLQILAPIWHVRMQTARTVRLRITGRAGVGRGHEPEDDNPADRVLPVPRPQNEVVKHRRAHREVAVAIRTLRGVGAGRGRQVGVRVPDP